MHAKRVALFYAAAVGVLPHGVPSRWASTRGEGVAEMGDSRDSLLCIAMGLDFFERFQWKIALIVSKVA